MAEALEEGHCHPVEGMVDSRLVVHHRPVAVVFQVEGLLLAALVERLRLLDVQLLTPEGQPRGDPCLLLADIHRNHSNNIREDQQGHPFLPKRNHQQYPNRNRTNKRRFHLRRHPHCHRRNRSCVLPTTQRPADQRMRTKGLPCLRL